MLILLTFELCIFGTFFNVLLREKSDFCIPITVDSKPTISQITSIHHRRPLQILIITSGMILIDVRKHALRNWPHGKTGL